MCCAAGGPGTEQPRRSQPTTIPPRKHEYDHQPTRCSAVVRQLGWIGCAAVLRAAQYLVRFGASLWNARRRLVGRDVESLGQSSSRSTGDFDLPPGLSARTRLAAAAAQRYARSLSRAATGPQTPRLSVPEFVGSFAVRSR